MTSTEARIKAKKFIEHLDQRATVTLERVKLVKSGFAFKKSLKGQQRQFKRWIEIFEPVALFQCVQYDKKDPRVGAFILLPNDEGQGFVVINLTHNKYPRKWEGKTQAIACVRRHAIERMVERSALAEIDDIWRELGDTLALAQCLSLALFLRGIHSDAGEPSELRVPSPNGIFIGVYDPENYYPIDLRTYIDEDLADDQQEAERQRIFKVVQKYGQEKINREAVLRLIIESDDELTSDLETALSTS